MKLSTSALAFFVIAFAMTGLAKEEDDANLRETRGLRGLQETTICVPSCPKKCFSGETTVDVLGKGEAINMRELEIGDKVLAAKGRYQTVVGFGQHLPSDSKSNSYLSIEIENNPNPLEITSNHMLYLKNKENPVPASVVQVGDEVVTSRGSSRVVKIATVGRSDAFAPLTQDGTIVVNNVLASNYVDPTHRGKDCIEIAGRCLVSFHAISHMWVSPLRLYCTKIAGPEYCRDHASYNEEGKHAWTEFGSGLFKAFFGWNIVYKALILFVVTAGFLVVSALDILLTPSLYLVSLQLAVVWTVRAWFQKKGSKVKEL